jgi:hypothetical protein
MFKKTAFKAFAPAFITLSLVVSIVILAACGSGGNGPVSDGESSSSRPPIRSSGSGDVDVETIKSISVKAELSYDETYLDLLAEVVANMEDPTNGGNWTLDKVDVELNGRKINRNITWEKHYTTPPDEQEYRFNGNEYCNDKDSQVAVYAYAHGKKVGEAFSQTFTRTKGVCAPSSSSTPSSSSAAVLTFSEISFSGGAKLGAEQGIIFSGNSGSITESKSEANIYYDGMNITVKDGGKIVDTFNPPRGPIYRGSGGSNVLTPERTSQFNPFGAGDNTITQSKIAEDQYFMIRTTGSSGEWTSSDYLFIIDRYSSSEPSITVKVWRVNN